jgi:hypothetical protein
LIGNPGNCSISKAGALWIKGPIILQSELARVLADSIGGDSDRSDSRARFRQSNREPMLKFSSARAFVARQRPQYSIPDANN